MRQLRCGVFAVAVAIIAGGGPVWADAPRPFADRPTTWSEHDDGDVPVAPPPSHIQDLDAALVLRDSLANEVDRVLALEGRSAAEDINAEDEVPCSTWFCPRNHLHPMTPDQVAAGAPADAPRLPLTIVKGKDEGAAIGFQVVDANGHKFMLKFDPVDHLGLATGGEMIGQRFFHAAGYNVPATFLVDLAPADLKLDPRATFLLRGVERRPVTEARVRTRLAGAARLPDGRLRAVAVAWIPGQILGGFDLIGRRAGDPNDRIPHQNRRSLRANWVLFAWLSVLDPSGINTLDSYVSDGDRHRFVRHYHIDFSCAFAGSNNSSIISADG